MSTVTSPLSGPLTVEAARQQVVQLYSVYQLSKFFSDTGDPNAIKRSGLFRPEEQAQLDWIARDPNVRQLLDNYGAKRDEMIKMDKETVRMWGDGSQRTTEQQEAYLNSLTAREGLNAVTANLLGAIGAEVGRQLFPDDPELATKMASMWATVGEMVIAHGEAKEARHENSEFRPGELGMEQHAPGKLEEGPENPFEATFTKNKPVGTDSFNPYETEVESPEGESPEAPESETGVDNGELFDGGIPMGVQGGEPQDSASYGNGPESENSRSADELNESVFDNGSLNQSFAEEPNASFPDDGFTNSSISGPNQSFRGEELSNQSSISQPSASFPEDPIANESIPTEPTQSFSSEPVEQGISLQSIQSPAPEESPMESAPIEPMSSEPMTSPESMESTAPAFDPG